MKFLKVLSFAVVALVVLIAGLLTALQFVDVNRYKGFLEKQITNLTGRQFSIAGDAQLTVNLQPRIMLSDIRLQNATWGSQAKMLVADKAELKIALFPLLMKRIKVLNLSVSGLQLLVESNRKHVSNWDLSGGKAQPKAVSDTKSGILQTGIKLHSVQLKNTRILYKKRADKQATQLHLDQVTISPIDKDYVHWNLAAKFDDIPVAIRGSTSYMHNLLVGRPFESDLGGNLGSVDFTLKGKVTLHKGLIGKGVDMNLVLKAPNLEQLSKLGSTGFTHLGPVTVKANLNDYKDGYKVSGLEAKIGESDINGEMSIAYQNKPISINANLSSTRLDLTPLQKPESTKQSALDTNTKARQEASKPRVKKGPSANVKRAPAAPTSGRVFSDASLPINQLKMLNADITYSIQELETGAQPLRNIKLSLNLNNGRLVLKPVQAQMEGGTIEGEMTLDVSESKSQPAIALHLEARKLKSDDFKQLKGLLTGGNMRTTVHLQSTGNSVREIMAGLNGETVLEVDKGTLHSELINLIDEDSIVKLLTVLVPVKAQTKTTTLECGVVKFEVQDGIAKTNKGIVLKTNKMVLVGKGKIDLKTEKIDIHFASWSRAAVEVDTGDLIGVVGLGGTLGKPKPILNVEGAAKNGATVSAAILTLGTSYLVQEEIESAIKDKHPCLTALGKENQAAEKVNEEMTKDTAAPDFKRERP